MAILTNKKQKQVKIFTFINHKMTISCNNMQNFINKAHMKGSCGILRYPAVSCGNQTDPLRVKVYVLKKILLLTFMYVCSRRYKVYVLTKILLTFKCICAQEDFINFKF